MPQPSQEAILDPLIGDFLAWVAKSPRTHQEVMEAWRTSCPRLSVYEDALMRGLVGRTTISADGKHLPAIEILPKGLAILDKTR